jgi:acyl phosphate:glycerol-3-phosphate acyltransferase
MPLPRFERRVRAMFGSGVRSGALGASAVIGYLLGTFPSADIVSRVATHGEVDLRRAGSGNPGAANAAEQLGRRWGAVVLLLDLAKGAAAGVAGRVIGGDDGAYLAATASIAGHVAPPWNGFNGGKGVATSAGACLAVFPVYFPVDIGVAALGATHTRNAERAVQLAGVAWVSAALAWWRYRLPNAWGPPPTRALPGFSATGAGMILFAFARARRKQTV